MMSNDLTYTDNNNPTVGKSTGLSNSLIICTKNRPVELQKCISSIINQTRLPDELILIDDGNIDEQVFKTLHDHNIKYVFYKKDIPGLTTSRNIGVNLARSDIITFVDDDVVLDKDYIATVMSAFEQDKAGSIGGITGTLINGKQGVERNLLRLFFLDGNKPGTILPSGIGVLVKTSNISAPTEVQWLSGSNMSYRKSVFTNYRFNEVNYQDYAWGEDREFSFRVGTQYKLVALPNAKLIHAKTPVNRVSSRTFGFMETYNLYLFFRSSMPHKPLNIFAFTLALIGIILKNIIRCFKPSNFSLSFYQLMGNFTGLSQILSHSVYDHLKAKS